MDFFSSQRLLRWRFVLVISFCCAWLLSGSSLQAAQENSPLTATGERPFPEQLGTVVYQTEPAAPSRIYIIANAHRSAISGIAQAETLQAQFETFRIGEWLIKQHRIDLLLPEGFFGEMGRSQAIDAPHNPLDNQAVREALADTTHFVNAELLLHEKYGIGLEQVEDRTLYRDVRELLAASLEPGTEFSFARYSELAHLQKLRTAYLIQTAPAVTAAAYEQGRIAAPKAMLTIGLSHLQDIVSFLETGQIGMTVRPAAGTASPLPGARPELTRQKVGITVIVPRTLMSNKFKVAKSNGLGKESVFTR